MRAAELRSVSFAVVLGLTALLAAPPAAADCTASAGSVANIEADGVDVSCDAEDPNPFTTGIGSTSTNTNLTVTVAAEAQISTSATAAVNLGDRGELTNNGSVRSSLQAVIDTSINGTGSVSVTNSGTLEGNSGFAVDLVLSGASVTNSGTIIGVLGGVRIEDGAVENSGIINVTGADGIAIDTGVATNVDNSGTITSSGTGVNAGPGASVTNSGTITASGTGLSLGSGGDLSNSGTIVSSAATAIVTDGGAVLTNSARIEGSALAVELRGGNNTLTLDTGSELLGDVLSTGATPADTLVLNGTGAEDASFQNFAALVMQGEAWTLSGAVGALGATIESGVLTINGSLDTRLAGLAPGEILLLGGSLTGRGTLIGDLTNSAGGVTVGERGLVLSGDYEQGSAASLRVGDGNVGIGSFQISGTAALDGELVIAAGSDAVADVLTADGGISGDFSSIRTDGRAQVAVSVSANSVRIIRASTSVQDSQLDAALDSAYVALDSLTSGIGEPRTESGLWLRGIAHYGERKERDELPGGEWWISGLMFGGDVLLGNRVRLGGGVGYSRTNLDADDGSELDADNVLYGVYLDVPGERFWGRVALAGGATDTAQSRVFFLEGSDGRANADFDSSNVSVRGVIGGRFGFEPFRSEPSSWFFEPSLVLDYVRLDQDPYSEVGGSDLSYATEADVESLQVSGLLTVRRPFQDAARFAPRFYLGVVHRSALDDRAWIAAD
ncbi:MAG: autotransporter domain-containing protein, partial [Pseudomonadota bacterium]